MVTVHIPALLRDRTGGAEQVAVAVPAGERLTVGHVLDLLESRFPGLREGLLYRGDLMPGIAVFVDNEQAFLGLGTQVHAFSHIHFLPPVVGGS